MDWIDVVERVNREKHEELMATLEHMHYFQCQVRERMVGSLAGTKPSNEESGKDGDLDYTL